MDVKKRADYYSFLLRLWRVKEPSGKGRRASLENVETGEKHGYTNLEELWVYLRQLTANDDNTARGGIVSEVQG